MNDNVVFWCTGAWAWAGLVLTSFLSTVCMSSDSVNSGRSVLVLVLLGVAVLA